MNEYRLSYVNNTKTGRACFGLLMVPAFFLGWIILFHYREYEQVAPIWFVLPILILGIFSLLKINIQRKGDEILTYMTLAGFTLKKTVKHHVFEVNNLFSTINTKITGEYKLCLGSKELDVYLIGNIEKHVIILNALFTKR